MFHLISLLITVILVTAFTYANFNLNAEINFFFEEPKTVPTFFVVIVSFVLGIIISLLYIYISKIVAYFKNKSGVNKGAKTPEKKSTTLDKKTDSANENANGDKIKVSDETSESKNVFAFFGKNKNAQPENTVSDSADNKKEAEKSDSAQ